MDVKQGDREVAGQKAASQQNRRQRDRKGAVVEGRTGSEDSIETKDNATAREQDRRQHRRRMTQKTAHTPKPSHIIHDMRQPTPRP